MQSQGQRQGQGQADKKTVLVFGATGKQGRSICNALKQEYRVLGAARDIDNEKARHLKDSGVELFRCDLSDCSGVREAFQAADKPFAVFLITNYYDESQCGKEQNIAKCVAEMARDNQVGYFLFSSLPNCEAISGGKCNAPSFTDKGKAVNDLKQIQGLKSIFLEPAFYYQNCASWTPVTREDDTFIFNLPLKENVKLHSLDITQLGEVARLILRNPEPFVGKCVPIFGDTLTGKEFADQFTDVTKQKAEWRSMSCEELKQKLQGARYHQDMCAIWDYFNEHGYYGTEKPHEQRESRDLNTLKRMLPDLHLRSYKEWLQHSGWKGETYKQDQTSKWGPQVSKEELQKHKQQQGQQTGVSEKERVQQQQQV